MKILKKIIVLALFALIGWGICGIIYYYSEIYLRDHLAILIHFLTSPFIFAGLTHVYFTRFNYTRPVGTALIVIGSKVILDFLAIRFFWETNIDMFSNLMASWIPYVVSFFAIFLIGLKIRDQSVGH